MKEQQNVIIQVRVGEALKRDAMKVLDKIGIDMPTAIRVFFETYRCGGRYSFQYQSSERRERNKESSYLYSGKTGKKGSV